MLVERSLAGQHVRDVRLAPVREFRKPALGDLAAEDAGAGRAQNALIEIAGAKAMGVEHVLAIVARWGRVWPNPTVLAQRTLELELWLFLNALTRLREHCECLVVLFLHARKVLCYDGQ